MKYDALLQKPELQKDAALQSESRSGEQVVAHVGFLSEGIFPPVFRWACPPLCGAARDTASAVRVSAHFLWPGLLGGPRC